MSLTKSAATVLHAYNEPVEVREFEVPDPHDDALVVKVEASTMCGTDVHMHAGDLVPFSRLPVIMGHEIVGRVAALGKNRVTDAVDRPLAEGDLVAWSYAWCGHCYWCTVARQPTLCSNARMYGWGPANEFPYVTGGFAEYAYIMPQCKVVKVPENLDPALAASSTCSFRTVMHGFEALGPVSTIDTILVQGSGPVGLYATAVAAQSGARQVLVIGAPDDRLQIARHWGATHTFNVLETEAAQRKEQILALTDRRGPDIVIECSGAGPAFPEGLDLVRKGGRYLVIGQADPRPQNVSGTIFNMKQINVMGVLSADIPHYYKALNFLADHQDKYPFHELLGNRYTLHTVNDALASMGAHRETKPVILPQAA